MNTKNRIRAWLISVTQILLVSVVFGQTPENVVKWSASGPATANPGAHIAVKLNARIEEGWHIYSVSQPPGGPTTTVISFPANQPFHQSGAMVPPTPQSSFDPNFNIETETHEGNITFKIPVAVDRAAAEGNQKIAIDVLFQTCNETTCLPPYTAHLFVSIKILKKAGVSIGSLATEPPNDRPNSIAAAKIPLGPSQSTAPSSTASAIVVSSRRPNAMDASADAAAMRSRPLGSFLWFAMAMGALSLLTPCVFPMVPITVSYFSNHGSGTRRGAIMHALIYGVGIVLTFSALGLALAILFGAAGVNQLAANPWMNLLITAIFVAFAFSLFGAFFLRIPAALMNKIDQLTRSKESGQIVGALLMGLTFTLTSFTCTAPFVGTLLVMAAQGSWRWPLMGMLAYSTVFALPFFVLALAPQLVSQLPRSGAWMNSVKVVMGFLEIAAAMKFLSNADLVWRWGIFTRETVLAVWIACGIASVLYICGLFRFGKISRIERFGIVRLTAALAFLIVTIGLVPGLFGKPLGELDSFLPPVSAELRSGPPAKASANGETQWILNDYQSALQQARRQNKPVFIDFTGYTCTNCRWMEANMFPRPEVRSELNKFVTVRLYTDGKGSLYQTQQRLEQDRFGTVALPLYAILQPDGTSVATFTGLTRDPSKFIDFLRSAGRVNL